MKSVLRCLGVAALVCVGPLLGVTTPAAAATTSTVAFTGPPSLSCPAVNSTLKIPNQLESALNVDKVNHTVTLPLYKGAFGDQRVWFILTDTSDLTEAARLGINWSPKLANGLGTPAVQNVMLSPASGSGVLDSRSVVHFQGTIDFSGQRVVIPGPTFFPVLTGTHAGPIGDAKYSPLFTFGSGVVYNGEQIANPSGVHPKVVAIDFGHRMATLRMTEGRYLDRQVLYLSTDASDTVVGALENATFAPNLGAAPQRGSDFCVNSPNSASEAIIPIVNGALGVNDPANRQGLQSAVAGEGDPLNIIREEPECSDSSDPAVCSALQYSPLWDATPVAWTQAAIDAGQRVRIGSHETVESLFNAGELVNANPTGPSQQDSEIFGLRALGVVIDCPPMFVAPA
jgi:hypothetical protein